MSKLTPPFQSPVNPPSSVSTSPPFSSPPSKESPENQTIDSSTESMVSDKNGVAQSNLSDKYSVASHSVRITKCGYAIDPVELRYPEIINNLSVSSRRSSDISFDSSQIGHMILGLIRGFWSQPAFPKGSIKSNKQTSINSILAEFSQIPPYPHKETFGSIAKDRLVYNGRSKNKSSSQRTKKAANISRINITNNQAAHDKPAPKLSLPKTLSPSELPDNNTSIKDKFFTLTSPPLGRSSGSSGLSSLSSSSSKSSPKKRGKQNSDNSSLLSLFISKHSSKNSSKSSPKQSTPPTTYYSWIPRDKNQIYELISTLCQRMERIFYNEARIINVSSPCIVLGDIHGNLSDLRTYERSLWPKAPVCVSCNYLFLGDYVDRGDYSVECVLYLFAMKLISPRRFFLLRGNHEVAAIQRQYTFSRECEAKFGPIGRQLWKEFNRVFDRMPVAAIVDNQIFCAHGGIPRSITEIKTLVKEIPCPMDNPEIQCPSAWEILWNDPITDSELIGMIEMDNAVVTQTQITQTQPTPDNKEMVTTTTNSTAITSEVPIANNKTTTTVQNDPSSPPKTTTTTKTTSTLENRDTSMEALLSDADSILTREPSVALSFYIRPDDQQQPDGSTKPLSTASKEANSNKDDENTLRTVPSDTSSIASTTPQQMINDGFVANIKRGTAFLFSDQAINNFLKANQLSHVIRAHEVIPTGFAFHGDGRVITIFSSSKYCGLNNQAACALVDQGRIRILRLDTGDAGE